MLITPLKHLLHFPLPQIGAIITSSFRSGFWLVRKVSTALRASIVLLISSSENTFLFPYPRNQHSSSLSTKSTLNWSALLVGVFPNAGPSQPVKGFSYPLLHSGPACDCSYPIKFITHFCAWTASIILSRMISISVYLLTYPGTYSTLLPLNSLCHSFSFNHTISSNVFSSSTYSSPYRLPSLMLGLFY